MILLSYGFRCGRYGNLPKPSFSTLQVPKSLFFPIDHDHVLNVDNDLDVKLTV